MREQLGGALGSDVRGVALIPVWRGWCSVSSWQGDKASGRLPTSALLAGPRHHARCRIHAAHGGDGWKLRKAVAGTSKLTCMGCLERLLAARWL
jgi:hypothetical protein